MSKKNLLLDHGDMRMIAADADDRDHAWCDRATRSGPPGFRDQEYRARRNAIAAMAIDHQSGTPIPDAPYTREEHLLWRIIRDALDSAHRQYACAEYLDCVQKLELPRIASHNFAKSPRRFRHSVDFVWNPSLV